MVRDDTIKVEYGMDDVKCKLGDTKKFSILKNGIGIKCQKSTKKVRDERNMEANKRLKCY